MLIALTFYSTILADFLKNLVFITFYSRIIAIFSEEFSIYHILLQNYCRFCETRILHVLMCFLANIEYTCMLLCVSYICWRHIADLPLVTHKH